MPPPKALSRTEEHAFACIIQTPSLITKLRRGNGFQTTGITVGSGNDPNPFFKALFSKPYLNQVVISPHIYGPSVSLATDNFSGPGLWNHLSASFGYLTKTGYTHNGVTKRFAVVIGETGSTFSTAADLQVCLCLVVG